MTGFLSAGIFLLLSSDFILYCRHSKLSERYGLKSSKVAAKLFLCKNKESCFKIKDIPLLSLELGKRWADLNCICCPLEGLEAPRIPLKYSWASVSTGVPQIPGLFLGLKDPLWGHAEGPYSSQTCPRMYSFRGQPRTCEGAVYTKIEKLPYRHI